MSTCEAGGRALSGVGAVGGSGAEEGRNCGGCGAALGRAAKWS